MAKQRYVNTKFCSDVWIREKLNPLDRYLFLYFLTNEHTNICGVYELPLSMIAFETGIDKEDLTKSMFPRLKPKMYYCDGWVIMMNFIKHQNQNSPKIQAGINIEMKKIPQEIQEKMIGYRYPMDTLSHPNTNTNSNSNSESDALGGGDFYEEEYKKEDGTKGVRRVYMEKEEPKNQFIKEANELLTDYYKGFKERISDDLKKMPIYPKEAYLKQLKPILKKYPIEQLKVLLKKYLMTRNDIYKKNKWSMSCFLSWGVLNQLK